MKEFEYAHVLMGSSLDMAIIAPDEAVALRERDRALALGLSFEERFSRFLPDSELSLLNTERTRIVSPEFMEVLLVGRMLYRETGGIFNPLVQIERLGYTKDFKSLSGTAHVNTDPYDTNMETILIDEETGRVTLQEGQRLDFGGFLKGYAAEAMAGMMRDVNGAIVNIGGDIFARGHDASDEPFAFGIFNPVLGDESIVETVEHAGIASSGTYRRVWDTDRGKKHHILDAHGHDNPTTDLMSATVIARDGFRADAYATVAVVLGSHKAPAFLEEAGARFVLITDTGAIITEQHS